MAAQAVDPNRYAAGAEAQEIRARLDIERELLKGTSAARAKAQRHLNNIEMEIRDQKAVLAALEVRRQAHSAFLCTMNDRHQLQLAAVAEQSRPLHPLRKASLEVLGQIFEECYSIINIDPWKKFDLRGAQFRSDQEQPFKLAAVCRRWRLASLRSARCWSRIHFDFDKITEDGIYESMLRTVMARSTSSPLTVTVIRGNRTRACHRKAVNLLKSALGTCVHLIFDVGVLENGDMLHAALGSPVPQLVHAHLSIGDDLPLDASNFGWLSEARSLKYLNVNSVMVAFLRPAPQPASLVLRYPCCGSEDDDVRRFMRAYPSTIVLSIVCPLFTHSAVEGNPVVCTAVEILRVDCAWLHDIEPLWQTIRTPRLRTLELRGNLTSVVSRISLARTISGYYNITELNFSTLDSIHIMAFVGLIHVMKRLTFLIVCSATFTRTALQTLCHGLAHRSGRNGPWTNPALVKVHLLECEFSHRCDLEELFNCASLRMKGTRSRAAHRIPRLEQFRIYPANGESLSREVKEVKIKLDTLLASVVV